MRILFCGLNYAPDLIGVAKYNTELCEGLNANGDNVHVVTAPPYYSQWKIPKLAETGATGTRHGAERALRRVAHAYWRFSRGMTLGVRALVIDGRNRIFLVKHSYASGWHLPGGGVEPGETVIDALIRELREECNIEPTAPPRLHGVFFNHRESPRDHVVVFVVEDFRQFAEPRPGYEIIAHGFFGLDDLPNDTTAPTRARIVEVIGGVSISERW